MVEKREDLGNAIALNSFLFNGARLVGPSIAGILISILGEGNGGSQTYGFLMAASGMGAVIGAVYLASRRSVLGLGRIIAIASGIFGIGLISFSLSHVLWLSLILMMLTGFGMIVHMASSNTILQTMVDDDKRGRVMSLYTMSFMGMAPFGSLLGGSLASKIGAPYTLIICGAFCILGSFMFTKKLPSIRKMVRPIYIRKGILSEKSEIEIPTKN